MVGRSAGRDRAAKGKKAATESGGLLLYGPRAPWLAGPIAHRSPSWRRLLIFWPAHPSLPARPAQAFRPIVTDSPADFYHQKTDAELLFFVENPTYYQPELVESARRELYRRGVAPAQFPPGPPAETYLALGGGPGRPAFSPGRGVLLGVGVLVLGLGGLYFIKQKNRPDAVETGSPAPVRRAPPQLTEVATAVIPNYDGAVARSVDQQLRRVPAPELAAATRAAQPLRQYRELAKRFWTAETQTEYVLDQARRGRLSAALPGHVESADASWQQWNRALLYRYTFGPVMANHLDLMRRVARQQQEALRDLLLVANNPQQYENDKTRQRAADVSDLLGGLLPKSPVTGQPYEALVRRVQL